MGIPADQLPERIRRLMPPEPAPAPAVIEKFDAMEKYDKEKELQDAALKWLRLHGWCILYHARTDQPATAQVGVPDILAIKNGRTIGAEAKLPGRKPTLPQIGFIEIINLHGGYAFIFHSLEELITELAARKL